MSGSCGGFFPGDGAGGGIPGVLTAHDYFADQMDVPNNADWAVNALSPSVADPTNNAIVVAEMDDTTEEGRGFIEMVPALAVSLTLQISGRAQTAPGAARTVGQKLYYRNSPSNAAVTAWSSIVLTDLAIPTNAFFQYFSQTLVIGGGAGQLNVNAGFTSQFELTRLNPTAGTELVGNFLLRRVSFLWNF
jgi:hypothetical protein